MPAELFITSLLEALADNATKAISVTADYRIQCHNKLLVNIGLKLRAILNLVIDHRSLTPAEPDYEPLPLEQDFRLALSLGEHNGNFADLDQEQYLEQVQRVFENLVRQHGYRMVDVGGLWLGYNEADDLYYTIGGVETMTIRSMNFATVKMLVEMPN